MKPGKKPLKKYLKKIVKKNLLKAPPELKKVSQKIKTAFFQKKITEYQILF